ncbi:DNA topoisomerase [Trichuris trichiura]|uniref:DNA topoisomerase n=1 Tax=Trichuris trichiura TaxID=36087 RepID=A0A077ZCG1_TRITR|nr:DNA topoisomerase [Trichuris trichiura]
MANVVLNVAEKNDAAKGIAQILSRGHLNRKEGFSRFNKLYEFDYTLEGRQCRMVFSSVSGHLMNLDYTSAYRNWQSVPIDQLFDAPLHKECNPDMKPILRTLKSEAAKAKALIIWTDCDREGENIGFEIIEVCKQANPRLDVRRAVFSEITRASVLRALANLAEPNKRLSDAVDCRMELDLRTGAAFTRFQTLRLRQVFAHHLQDKLISYGSCQFPTLGFVVERYKQNQAFVREPFWKLVAIDGGRIFDKDVCELFLALCQEQPGTAKVKDVVGKPTTKLRPLPLETVEMEKLISQKLRISAKETMSLAEKLYTQGYISYPRTETNCFAKEINLVELVQIQTADSQWGDFAQRVLESGPNPRNGKKNDQAHPPIHPIRYAAPQELIGNLKRVYDFIVRHFLACVSKNAEGFQTTVAIDVNGEIFRASGLRVIARNYLDVYPYETWNSKEIPAYNVNEVFNVDVRMSEGVTSPPPLLSEAELIGLMEKCGIGTDATHAEHIETIKKRLYVGLTEENRFLPGYLGLGLVDGYESIGCDMSKPNLRAEFEAELKKICDGVQTKESVLRIFRQKYKELYDKVVQSAERLDAALMAYFGPTDSASERSAPDNPPATSQPQLRPFGSSGAVNCTVCTSCGSFMQLKTARSGRIFVGCSGYPTCKEAIWIRQSDLISSYATTNEQCPRCVDRASVLVELRLKNNSFGLPPVLKTCFTCSSMVTVSLGVQLPSMASSGSLMQIQNPVNAPQTVDSPLCHCAQPSAMRTCRNGANAGRDYFACATSSCRFFSWKDLNSPATSQRATRTDSNPVMCNCGLECSLLTVRKEGPNKGRNFYSCSKAPSERCRFFLWADISGDFIREAAADAGSSGARISIAPAATAGFNFFPSVVRPSPSSAKRPKTTAANPKRRKCGICRQEGHTAKTCPQKAVA